jgi:hypothetical protein
MDREGHSERHEIESEGGSERARKRERLNRREKEKSVGRVCEREAEGERVW